MNFCEVLEKRKEYFIARKLIKRDLRTEMANMGHYPCKIRIDSEYIEIRLNKELTKNDIQLLEKKYKVKMTLCDEHHIRNIDEPLYHLSGMGSSKLFIYRFRGDYNGN